MSEYSEHFFFFFLGGGGGGDYSGIGIYGKDDIHVFGRVRHIMLVNLTIMLFSVTLKIVPLC